VGSAFSRGRRRGVSLLYPSPYLTIYLTQQTPPLQANGINAILLFTPVVFKALQLSQNTALLSAAIIGGTLFLGTLVSMGLVDKFGRRPLLIQGGLQMLLALVGIAALLGVASPAWSAGSALLSSGAAAGLLALMAVFVAGFSWSWGPLGWLVPSEIAPLPVRSAAQSVFTLVNFCVAFISTQTYLPLLCRMTYWTYVLFAGCVLAMVAYAVLALPETAGVPIEQMAALWRSHWLWKRVLPPRLCPAGPAGGAGGGGDAIPAGV
jgi:MFS transporter, SP family, sugar:H+ symporter